MENTTFSSLLRQILMDENLNLSQFHSKLVDLGADITYPSLYAYYMGKTVPTFSCAKEILEKEKVKVNTEDLLSILKYSRELGKVERNDEDKILHLNLKIKPEQVNKDFKNSAKLLKSTIEMRSKELFAGNEQLITQFSATGKRKISAYIAYLIKEDLNKNNYFK